MIVCPTFHTAFPYRPTTATNCPPLRVYSKGELSTLRQLQKLYPGRTIRDLDEFKILFFVVLIFWVGWIFDREYGIWMEYGIMNT